MLHLLSIVALGVLSAGCAVLLETSEQPAPFRSSLQSEAFRKSLSLVKDDIQQSMDLSEQHQQFVIRAAHTGGITVTAGVLTWLLRGGFLLASLAATMPAWRHFDPLPVVLVSDRKRGQSKVELAAATAKENEQFHGLKDLLDKKEEDKGPGGEGMAT